MKNKPEVYCLCGKIGSGKSTVARAIKEETGAVIINLDAIMEPLFGQTLGRPLYIKNLGICRDYVCNLADQILEGGLPVVFDFGFWSREDRKQTADRFAGRRVTFVYCPVNDTEQRRRVFSRNGSDDRTYAFNEEQLSFLNRFFEEPDDDEGLTILRESDSCSPGLT